MEDIEIWKTNDLACATFLALELKVDPTYEWRGHECYFTFQKGNRLVELFQTYASGDALVEPREFMMRRTNYLKAMNDANPSYRMRRAGHG